MGSSGANLDSLEDFVRQATRRYQIARQLPLQGTNGLDGSRFDGMEETQRVPQNLAPELDAAWQRAADIFASGEVVSGIVTGWNRGGLLVRWDALQGFVPASQLRDVTLFECDSQRDNELARWVGEELSLKVIELDRSRNRLVFSQRATIWGPRDGDRLLATINAGETHTGVVSNLCDFGAFVDLGGIDGLIHLSELSWRRVTHPRDLLSLGQEVQVYVISVDRENRRVALSLKRLRPNPWTLVESKYHVGQVIEATITNVVEFGAFAQIEEGLEGLIHISELAEDRLARPEELVTPGTKVLVRIIRIDSTNRRLGLSMRQTQEPAPEETQKDQKSFANLLY